MSVNGVHAFAQIGLPDFCREDDDVVEIPLLIPNWQAEALENVAHQQGYTAGELIRHLLLDYLSRHADR